MLQVTLENIFGVKWEKDFPHLNISLKTKQKNQKHINTEKSKFVTLHTHEFPAILIKKYVDFNYL